MSIGAAAFVVLIGAVTAAIAVSGGWNRTEQARTTSAVPTSSPTRTSSPATTPSVEPAAEPSSATSMEPLDPTSLPLVGLSVDEAVDVLSTHGLGALIVDAGSASTAAAVGTVASVDSYSERVARLYVYLDLSPLQQPAHIFIVDGDGNFAPSPMTPGTQVYVELGSAYQCPSPDEKLDTYVITATDGTFENGLSSTKTTSTKVPFTVGSQATAEITWVAVCRDSARGTRSSPPREQGISVGQ